jgi:hypothetical protein
MPRCEVHPVAGPAASFRVDGHERLRWHFGTAYPRPFFHPLIGPSGTSLTRIGHPGAPNHDHHLSIWFAHHKVTGVDFWGMDSLAFVRQKEWLVYDDADDGASMAVRLQWFDGHDPQPLLEQQLIVQVSPGEERETLIELQTTLTPVADRLEFGRTNFGFLAVRVAKSISEFFGGGRLTDSEGRTGEPAIFGKKARWMDYSGPVGNGLDEGITYFDHPTNPDHPAHWHVRADGWMGASVCFAGPKLTTKDAPLTLRYLLHAHAGRYDADRANRRFVQFAALPRWNVDKSNVPHTAWALSRG